MTTKSPRDHLTDWLRDAYAMEVQATQMLENMESRIKSYPEMQQRLRQHLEETRQQADQVRDCLQRLGTDTSSLKTAIAGFTGTMQAWSGIVAEDEVVKGAVFSYGFEQWEIANYTALIRTAEIAGETEIRTTLEGILRQEEAMADWLKQRIPDITQQYVSSGEKR
jgi:ferritin-like metal-binding protein YciE